MYMNMYTYGAPRPRQGWTGRGGTCRTQRTAGPSARDRAGRAAGLTTTIFIISSSSSSSR